MNKDFLDHLYADRFFLETEIKRLKSEKGNPQHACCDKMHYQSDCFADFKTRTHQLEMLDESIKKYIKTHSK